MRTGSAAYQIQYEFSPSPPRETINAGAFPFPAKMEVCDNAKRQVVSGQISYKNPPLFLSYIHRIIAGIN